MNEALLTVEQSLPRLAEDSYPCIYVCGSPRSGTTLMTQWLPGVTGLKPMNKIISKFWLAPSIGMEVSEALIGSGYHSDFSSNYGVTKRLEEPHEFSYFWNHVLARAGMIEPPLTGVEQYDPALWVSSILRMQCMAGNGLIFKAFMAAYYAEVVVKHLPKSIFLRLERSLIENCASMLIARESYGESIDDWVSIKPQGYEKVLNKSPEEQVAYQVCAINSKLAEIWSRLPTENSMTVQYEEFCENPGYVYTKLRKKLSQHGYVSPEEQTFQSHFEIQRPSQRLSSRSKSLLRSALSDLGVRFE